MKRHINKTPVKGSVKVGGTCDVLMETKKQLTDITEVKFPEQNYWLVY